MNEQSYTNMQVFRQLLLCGEPVYSWTCTANGVLIETNCPCAALLDCFFQDLRQHTRTIHDKKPHVIFRCGSLCWITEQESDEQGQILYVHLLGPVFAEDESIAGIDTQLRKQNVEGETLKDVMDMVHTLAVLPLPVILEYSVMLHYSLFLERIPYAKVGYSDNGIDAISDDNAVSDRSGNHAWVEEQQLLECIEHGNRRSKKATERYIRQLKMSAGSPVLQTEKYRMIALAALIVRKAIHAGVRCETAFSRNDAYVAMFDGAQSVPELYSILFAMVDDLTSRVYQAQKASGISSQMRACLDYIDLHLAEKITLNQLAKWSGYSCSHLSRKFREETGMSALDYILSRRIAKAQELLKISSQPIAAITAEVGFSSQSYFTEQFRKKTGTTPAQYRSDH